VALQLTLALRAGAAGGLRSAYARPGDWFDAWESRIAVAVCWGSPWKLLGWLEKIRRRLEHVHLFPGATRSAVGAGQGIVVVTVFRVFVTHLRGPHRGAGVMPPGVHRTVHAHRDSKFTYFVLLGIGVLWLGINAAGVDVTTLNVLTGGIGIGLGFGLQTLRQLRQWLRPVDRQIDQTRRCHQLHRATPATSTENFGWVQELRGPLRVVRDRDGRTLAPNQNLHHQFSHH